MNSTTKVRNSGLYEKYNKTIISNEDKNKIENDNYCPSCHLGNDERDSARKSGGLGWPVSRCYQNNERNSELINISFKSYNEAKIALSIATNHYDGTENCYAFSPLFSEIFDASEFIDHMNQCVGAFRSARLSNRHRNLNVDNLNDVYNNSKFLDFCYIENKEGVKKNAFKNFNESSLILYWCNTDYLLGEHINPTVELYGNVWIRLTGSRDCDFAEADSIAKTSGLFGYTTDKKGNLILNNRPSDYTWHHVYMGWFDYDKFIKMMLTEAKGFMMLTEAKDFSLDPAVLLKI